MGKRAASDDDRKHKLHISQESHVYIITQQLEWQDVLPVTLFRQRIYTPLCFSSYLQQQPVEIYQQLPETSSHPKVICSARAEIPKHAGRRVHSLSHQHETYSAYVSIDIVRSSVRTLTRLETGPSGGGSQMRTKL
jgi:hypothetical protein